MNSDVFFAIIMGWNLFFLSIFAFCVWKVIFCANVVPVLNVSELEDCKIYKAKIGMSIRTYKCFVKKWCPALTDAGDVIFIKNRPHVCSNKEISFYDNGKLVSKTKIY